MGYSTILGRPRTGVEVPTAVSVGNSYRFITIYKSTYEFSLPRSHANTEINLDLRVLDIPRYFAAEQRTTTNQGYLALKTSFFYWYPHAHKLDWNGMLVPQAILNEQFVSFNI